MKTNCQQMVNILKLVRRLIDTEMKKKMQEMGMSRTGWQVLFWMRSLKSCTQKELQNHMDIDAGHLARVLEEFEKRRYIVRSACKEDRRCLSIEMTEEGKQMLMPDVERSIAKEKSVLYQGFTEQDKTHLSQLLSRLEKNLEGIDNE